MYFKPFTLFLLLLTFGGWSCQTINASRILALFINGHRSHLMLYVSVVNLLLERGHIVTVVTTEDLDDLALVGDTLRWIKLSDQSTKPRIITTNGGDSDEIERMMRRIENTAEFLKNPVWLSFMQETNHYDLMILGYLFNDYQLGVAAHFKCPVVVLWTGQPIGFINSLIGNPEMRSYVPQPYDRHQFKGFKALAFGWFEKFIEMLALYKMKEIYDEHYPEPHYPSFWEMRKNVSLALCNHHSLSEGPIAPFVPGIIEIGGLEYQRTNTTHQENELDSLLLNQQKLIYFSFGSRVKWTLLDPDLANTFVKAFQIFPNHTILWTYDKNCSELQTLSPNILCKSWWPQTAILASNKTQLFITHGGKGSISEAYRYGKPILGFPFFGDQRANVAKVHEKQLGIKLNIYKLTLEDLVTALHNLLDHNEYTANMARYSLIYRNRPISSEDSVIYWLEYVIRYRGARHLRSPALDLNLIEYYNLDVYVVIVLVLWTLGAVCNWLEQTMAYMA